MYSHCPCGAPLNWVSQPERNRWIARCCGQLYISDGSDESDAEKNIIKRPGTQYIGTLPDGYEWRLMLGNPLRIVGFNQTNGIKVYRVEELKLIEEEKGFYEAVPTKE
jgi:hypothetical protein